MELEHARLLQQGWRLAEDGTYRKVSRIPQDTTEATNADC